MQVDLPISIMVLLDEMRTLKSGKGTRKIKRILWIRIPYMVCIPCMELRRVAGLLLLFCR
jgi:hypothetical protein